MMRNLSKANTNNQRNLSYDQIKKKTKGLQLIKHQKDPERKFKYLNYMRKKLATIIIERQLLKQNKVQEIKLKENSAKKITTLFQFIPKRFFQLASN